MIYIPLIGEDKLCPTGYGCCHITNECLEPDEICPCDHLENGSDCPFGDAAGADQQVCCKGTCKKVDEPCIGCDDNTDCPSSGHCCLDKWTNIAQSDTRDYASALRG